MAYEAKEGMNFCIGLCQSSLSNGFEVCITRLDTLPKHLVCQVVYLFLKKTTLWWFQLEIVLPESVKHNAQSVEVFLCGLQEHN